MSYSTITLNDITRLIETTQQMTYELRNTKYGELTPIIIHPKL